MDVDLPSMLQEVCVWGGAFGPKPKVYQRGGEAIWQIAELITNNQLAVVFVYDAMKVLYDVYILQSLQYRNVKS